MFAIITPALVTGGFADRVSFRAYLLFLVLWSLLVYIPFVHWIWGGGFLAQWGVKDFAGGIVVHLSAGMGALASVFVIGRRNLAKDENAAGHNIPFVALGAGLLWFGWFGFNGGSALAANGFAAVMPRALARLTAGNRAGRPHTGAASPDARLRDITVCSCAILPTAGGR